MSAIGMTSLRACQVGRRALTDMGRYEKCPLLALSGHQLASALQMSAIGGKADIALCSADAR